MTQPLIRLCVIPGDGIGPEVTQAAITVLEAATDRVQVDWASAGWQTFCEQGDSVPEATLEKIRDCGAALFGAVASPARKVEGYRSAILKIRQTLDLYANLRPVRGSWALGGREDIDLTIVRENTEGLYVGQESIDCDGRRATAERVITQAASQRIGEMAGRIAEQRSTGGKVTIVHKANVLPLSDGLFRDSVRSVLQEMDCPLQIDEGLVDIVAHRLVTQPEQFQVIVTTNMFGDILSDLAACWCGGMGRAPSLNLGAAFAVAEPVHGSAPDIAGQGVADPTASILSLALLCRHHWQDAALAERLEQAVKMAIQKWGQGPMQTDEFTRLVIHHLKPATISSLS